VAITCRACGEQNPQRARFCLNCATPLEAPAEREERKLATVLFADLVGSTAMAGEQDPERTRQVLNRFYDAMREEVERCGGTVEKFAGDAVMAAFGAPAALEDHAERALHAGLAMQRRMRELFRERLALRIGINTGDVLVGRPREGSSFVTGDSVNVAARLEQAAAAGEILAGERTFAAALGAFEFDEPTTIEAKGKPGGVMSRRVVRALTLMRPRGVRGMPSVFVGREAELEELQDRYRLVASDGHPHQVTMLGDAGVGKSRLTRELWSWLGSQSPEPIRRTGRTLSYGQGTTYWPMGEVLKEHFGISQGESQEAIATRLGDRPYLGLTLGFAADEDLHPLVARERLHDAWVTFLEELVTDRPAVMLIEDVHWAEDDLCDLIDTLVGQVSGPLLMLVTARPELVDRRPAWGGGSDRASVIRLQALAPADTSRLLDRLLGTKMPELIRDVVVERAEGNPFFVEELIATLVDRGVVRDDNGRWSFGDMPTGFTVPDSVQAVLAARIDLLPAAEKAALQAASVIGRTFWTGPVYELVGGAPPDVGLLEEREFVRRRTTSSLPGEREYVIKHALTRDVAYGSLPKAQRARLHAAFAAWMERRVEGHDELVPLLAHHYAEAVRPEDLDLAWAGQDAEVDRLRASAVAWSRRAAELVVGRYEIDNGLALLRRAVELERDRARQSELWYEIGYACALKYDGEGFVAAMEKALELGAPEAQVYPELAFQTSQRQGMWQRQLDNELVGGWIDRAVAVAMPGTPAQVHALVASARWYDDIARARQALAVAEELGDPRLRSDALGALQGVLELVGQLPEASRVAQARSELLPLISDPDHRADALFMTADLFIQLGRMTDARAIVRNMEETVAGLTPHHRIHGLGTRLRLEAAMGDWVAVNELTERTEDAVGANLATPCPFNVVVLLILALAKVTGGDAPAARRLVAKAADIGMVGYTRFHTARRLRLAIARQDREEIRRLVDSIQPSWLVPGEWELWAALLDGLAMIGDQDRIEAEAPKLTMEDTYVTPFAVRALGMVRNDPALLSDAAARFEAIGLLWHAQETRQASERLRS
jgi:class 3 adenylate cyclase/tetratricopeptide (TPR) repeat protein